MTSLPTGVANACPWCGSSVWRQRHPEQKWCSRQCSDMSRRLTKDERRDKWRKWNRIRAGYPAEPIVKCSVCGVTITNGRIDRKYCSSACRGKARNQRDRGERRVRVCPECGDELNEIKRSDAVYCSVKCHDAYNSRHRKRSLDSERQRYWTKRRPILLSMARARRQQKTSTCVICGMSFHPFRVEVTSSPPRKYCSSDCRKYADYIVHIIGRAPGRIPDVLIKTLVAHRDLGNVLRE